MTRRYRIACVGPWPPMRSGVADYAALVIPPLAERFDLTVFSPEDKVVADGRFPVLPLDRMGDCPPFDAVLYQLGNDVRLERVYRLALKRPGIVILHDPVLHPLVSELTWGRGDRGGFWRDLAYQSGTRRASEIANLRHTGGTFTVSDYPLSARLVDSSIATLVHSSYAAQLLRQASPAAVVRTIAHPAFPRQARDRAEARWVLGLDEDEYLVGAFGFATGEKRFHILLPAFRAFRAEVPNARLVVVGDETQSCPLAEMIRVRGMEGMVHVTGWVEDEVLEQYLDAVDVSVHLRYPTMGETSGSVVRCLTAGHPLIVSDTGWFSELPDDCAIKIPVGDDEVQQLTAALTRIARDPTLARRMGQASADYARDQLSLAATIETIAGTLLDAIEGRLRTGWQNILKPAIGSLPDTRNANEVQSVGSAP